jgi:hypothetical protein
MNRKSFIVFIFIIHLSTILNGQNMDSIGIDNNPYIKYQESNFLNSQLNSIRDTFNFRNTKVAYYLSLVGYIQKQDYFKEAKQYSEKGQTMSLQLIVLNASEKEMTNGFDVIIVSWHKFTITPKFRDALIKELKKAST